MAVNTYSPNILGQTYYPVSYQTFNPYYNQSYASMPVQTQQYMISVDGEGAAKAWQIPGGQTPNLIIPLWDLDGKHVYFKSTDAYGRMNPLRKGVIVFEEETVPQNNMSSEASPYVTIEDLNKLRDEIKSMLSQQNNQNGSRNNRGDNR